MYSLLHIEFSVWIDLGRQKAVEKIDCLITLLNEAVIKDLNANPHLYIRPGAAQAYFQSDQVIQCQRGFVPGRELYLLFHLGGLVSCHPDLQLVDELCAGKLFAPADYAITSVAGDRA